MALVVIESPFAGHGWWVFNFIQRWINILYARRCMADAFNRFETPFASHLLYTQRGILDDNKPRERHIGIESGFEWAYQATARIFYVDRGFSYGMRLAERHAYQIGQKIIYRSLKRVSAGRFWTTYEHVLGFDNLAAGSKEMESWREGMEHAARERLASSSWRASRRRCENCGGWTTFGPGPATVALRSNKS